MSADSKSYTAICELLEPFNKMGIIVTVDTSFAVDLELDSLTVMDFVANMEDHFDILIPLNILPDLETVGQVVKAVDKMIEEESA